MPAAPFRQQLERLSDVFTRVNTEANRGGGPRKNQLNAIAIDGARIVNEALEQGRGSGQ